MTEFAILIFHYMKKITLFYFATLLIALTACEKEIPNIGTTPKDSVITLIDITNVPLDSLKRGLLLYLSF